MHSHKNIIGKCGSFIDQYSGAFSLVELLASLAIIAVLVGLLFPATKSMVLKGKSAKDASNLRAIAQANITYAAENNQQCVIGFTEKDPTVPGDYNKTWYFELRPYFDKEGVTTATSVGSVPVYISPNDPTKGGVTGANAVAADSPTRRSYAINYYCREYVSGSGKVYRARKMMAMPATTMIFVGNFPAVQVGAHGISPNSDTSLSAIPRNWHSAKDMAQFAFLDGHVEMINVDDLQSTGKRYDEAWGPVPAVVPR